MKHRLLEKVSLTVVCEMKYERFLIVGGSEFHREGP